MPDPKCLAAALTSPARRALERAAERALRENHATVEIEHLLLELVGAEEPELALLLQREHLSSLQMLAALDTTISRFAGGSPRLPALSAALLDILSKAWLVASLNRGQNQVGSASIVCAIAQDSSRREAILGSTPALDAIFASPLTQNLGEWLRLGSETGAPANAASENPPENPALNRYTIDLTAQARAGLLDPVVGRDAEIGQVIDVLMRRRQNNPLLTGAAGVGKTAIVEGFACAIAEGRVPRRLADVVVRSLDLGLLQAGASLRGEFEQRLRGVVDEASGAAPRTVLFIDEAHMLIGAGGASGQGDAANLLKPALARGELGMIAATTWSEYKRFIEKDPALARRFQVIRIVEPTEDAAVEMLRSAASRLEAHHGVSILEEALAESVRLAHRFIAGRQLPEKAIAVLDTACARAASGRNAPALALAEVERRAASLAAKVERLRREALPRPNAVKLKSVERALADARERERRLEEAQIGADGKSFIAFEPARAVGMGDHHAIRAGFEISPRKPKRVDAGWTRITKRILASARASHPFLHGSRPPAKAIVVLDEACAHGEEEDSSVADLQAIRQRRAALQIELAQLQREAALHADRSEEICSLEKQLACARAEQRRFADLPRVDSIDGPTPSVDGRVIAEVISGWTGIPVGRMLADTLANIRELKARMAERIVDQDAALDTICRRIQTFYADLGEPSKPTGVFLLCGPSGVGKTETALTLAELLFGGARALVTVNMSEYQEAHSVSGLRGAPPGYVGYGNGGTLTEAIRRQPYCVLLLDEIEKAHPDVLEMFYQVFDRGMLEDSEGQLIDFSNTLILLTSNVGAEVLSEMAERNPSANPEMLTAAVTPVLVRRFSAAFVGRLVIAPYRPLSRRGVEAVTRLKLQRVQQRFADTRRGALSYDQRLVNLIAERADASESGARMIDSILAHSVLPQLSARILEHVTEDRPITGAHLSVGPDSGIVVRLH